jgi:hypothetical protein
MATNQEESQPYLKVIYLTTEETAAVLKIQPQTLAVWRMKGRGPRYIRLSPSRRSRCLYRRTDIEEYLASRTFTSTAAETPAAVGQAVSA